MSSDLCCMYLDTCTMHSVLCALSHHQTAQDQGCEHAQLLPCASCDAHHDFTALRSWQWNRQDALHHQNTRNLGKFPTHMTIMSHLHRGALPCLLIRTELRRRTDARSARWHPGLTSLRRLCWRCCQMTRSAGRMHSPPSSFSGHPGFCPSCIESLPFLY